MSDQLTPRETAVARLMACGLSNKEIGQALGITPHTVKNHSTKIFRKWRVNDRTQAVVCVFFLELITPQEAFGEMLAYRRQGDP